MRTTLAVVAASAFVSFVEPAHAATVKLCINTIADYGDSNIGEDVWNDVTRSPKRYRGGKARITVNGVVIFPTATQQYLSHSASDPGCTPLLTLPNNVPAQSTYGVTIYSEGVVNGTPFRVENALDGNAVASRFEYLTPSPAVASGGTAVLSNVPTGTLRPAFRVANAVAYALQQDNLGVTDTLVFRTPAGQGYMGTRVEIDQNASTSKYRIVHELGHLIGNYAVDFFDGASPGNGAGCNQPLNSGNDCAEDDAGHSFTSEDPVSCAVSEGWANFYAASTWNDGAQGDCWYSLMNRRTCAADADCVCAGGSCPAGTCVGGRCPAERCYDDTDCQCGGQTAGPPPGGDSCVEGDAVSECRGFDADGIGFCDSPRFDCETGCGVNDARCEFGSNHPVVPEAYIVNNCVVAAGEGNETDWLRQFWDMHNAAISVPASNIADVLATAGPWTLTSAYNDIDAAMEVAGGWINTIWEAAQDDNGICGNGLDPCGP